MIVLFDEMSQSLSSTNKKSLIHVILFHFTIVSRVCRAPDKKDIEDNSDIFFLFLNENICCDPSLEPSRRDGSNNGSQPMF